MNVKKVVCTKTMMETLNFCWLHNTIDCVSRSWLWFQMGPFFLDSEPSPRVGFLQFAPKVQELIRLITRSKSGVSLLSALKQSGSKRIRDLFPNVAEVTGKNNE